MTFCLGSTLSYPKMGEEGDSKAIPRLQSPGSRCLGTGRWWLNATRVPLCLDLGCREIPASCPYCHQQVQPSSLPPPGPHGQPPTLLFYWVLGQGTWGSFRWHVWETARQWNGQGTPRDPLTSALPTSDLGFLRPLPSTLLPRAHALSLPLSLEAEFREVLVPQSGRYLPVFNKVLLEKV